MLSLMVLRLEPRLSGMVLSLLPFCLQLPDGNRESVLETLKSVDPYRRPGHRHVKVTQPLYHVPQLRLPVLRRRPQECHLSLSGRVTDRPGGLDESATLVLLGRRHWLDAL